MIRKLTVLAAISVLAACSAPGNNANDPATNTEAASMTLIDRALQISAPVAEQRPVTIEQLGRTRVDEYGWLRDDNWQDVMRDPSVLQSDIRAHLEAENAYYEAVMSPTEALQERIFQEIRGRIREDDSSVPERDGEFEYYTRYREGGQYPIYARRPVDPTTPEEDVEQILLDGDAEAEGIEYLDFGNVDHSPDHRWLAYGVDTRGSEYYEIRIRDLLTGEDVGVLTDESTGDFAWANDSSTLFWVWRDANGRSKRVYRQERGSAASELIYDEADDGFFVNVGKTEGDTYIVIGTAGHTTSEVRLIDADNPTSDAILVAARETDVEYSLTETGDGFYILTNLDGAVDFQVMRAPIDAPQRENWEAVIPHRPGTLINGLLGFRNWMVRSERENALPRIVVRNLESGEEHTIAFEEEAYSLGIDAGYEFNTDVMRFSYESPSTPEETYDYDMATRERDLRKRQEIPSGHNPEDYVVRRIMAPAHDGEMIPVTILYHRDTPVDGSAPLMLYGYGSYGITIPAAFRVTPLSLVDRGMIYAIAHIRGSQARGYGWYLDGKLENKINTFRDFISAGEALIEQGFTARGNMVAYGGSAGGLLVGAAINMQPDLFAGAIAAVPFVDVINTMSDPSLPLTPPEWPEWGNPIEDPQAYDTIAEYSPYDNIAVIDYPHVLATAGLTDPRVTYWEPAKWTARLRATRSDNGLTLMRTNMGAGHGGASGRFDSLRETAENWAFALMTVGLADEEVAELATAAE
ncbi:S9 family peptidase [Hyphobacterium sp. HN65]|uniref:S9 family peptidase n=1 Tax=Hyphobacterium lacteum TaxID=3116575 RepID=A0ABU7LUK4_9PROT|nr:S9 family peptidase [Hyphobacterium sp. HN65]MEE2527024.1 S9 family peptidase [Hyphobacterium sp. HN65]